MMRIDAKKRKSSLLCLLLILILLFSSCANSPLPAPPIADAGTYSFHTELQRAYLAGKIADIDLYAEGKEELSRPLPITLDFSDAPEPYVSAEISKSISFDESLSTEISGQKAEIYNLEIGATYYYRGVTANGEKGPISLFRTENVGPRNLYIDGVTNARDLGGYDTAEGRIRQGMIYRTARLNANKTSEPTPPISAKGKETMLETLGVKTEIDLRRLSDNEIGSLTSSVLGESVRYVNCPMIASSEMITGNNESLRAFFSLLADEKNYPIFYHCSIGTDRTGYCSFLLLNLLGANSDDILRDYLFSNFGSIGGNRTTLNIGSFYLFLSFMDGADYREKAESFLSQIGVTEEEIEAIRRIMIE